MINVSSIDADVAKYDVEQKFQFFWKIAPAGQFFIKVER